VFLNAALIGLSTWQSGTINLHLPTAAALYDITNDVEYPAGTAFAISTEANHTYLFYRGSKAAWTAL